MRQGGVLRATGGDLANAGTLTMEAESAIERTWGPAYVVTNTGTLVKQAARHHCGGRELRNHGRVVVARGTLMTGEFRNAPEATLELTLSGAGHGQLAASGKARLDGTLAVATAGGYAPGSTHRLLTYTSREGQFASGYQASYDATGMTVTAPAAPGPARAAAAEPSDATAPEPARARDALATPMPAVAAPVTPRAASRQPARARPAACTKRARCSRTDAGRREVVRSRACRTSSPSTGRAARTPAKRRACGSRRSSAVGLSTSATGGAGRR